MVETTVLSVNFHSPFRRYCEKPPLIPNSVQATAYLPPALHLLKPSASLLGICPLQSLLLLLNNYPK